ncbi:MAG: LPS export ABC transporter permease LptG [Rhodospirillaceae bacterium]|nr:LPS export ABC transporter permease LptG [Rhodospirillaceae bacterium]
MILYRYLIQSYLAWFVALVAGLVIFLQTLDLLAEANTVLAGGGPPLASLLRYVSLRAPSIAETVAPLAGLLAPLLALNAMARNSEILAMRAAGRSVMSLVGGLMAAGAILSGTFFLFSEYVVVPANGEMENWKQAGFQTGDHLEIGESSWIVEGNTIVRVGHVTREGKVLSDVRIFNQAPDTRVTDILGVRLAIWETDHWTTFDVRRIAGADTSTPAWNTTLKPEQFVQLANHPNELSMNALKEYVGSVSVGSRPPYFYDTWLQHKFAGPVVLALMPLLAALAAFTHHRQGSPVLTIVLGITFGFMFVVINNILLAMGQFGSLPPLLAAWLPLALFATTGVWVLFNFEHTGART